VVLNDVLLDDRFSRLVAQGLIYSALILVCLRQEPVVTWNVARCLSGSDAI
jgi:hypothetical protein